MEKPHLTNAQLNELGMILSGITDTLELSNRAIDNLGSLREGKNSAIYAYQASKFLDVQYRVLQKTNEELENIIGILLSTGEKEDLKEFGYNFDDKGGK